MIECVGSPRFCTLSTIDENGKPWGAPLFYSWDADGNIYWTSAVRAQHSINIARTSDAYITILSDKPDPTNVGRNCVYLSVMHLKSQTLMKSFVHETYCVNV